MRRKGVWLVLLAFVIIAVLAITACGKKAEEGTEQGQVQNEEGTKPPKTLKIGQLMPFSGPGAILGESIKKDVDVYVELINEDGGLKVGDDTYLVEVYYGEDSGPADVAVKSTRELIENKGVQTILGYWMVSTPSIASVLMPQKMIFISTKPINYDPATMPYMAFSATDPEIVIPQVKSVLKWFKDTKKLGISSSDLAYEAGLKQAEPAISELMAEMGLDSQLFVDIYPWSAVDPTTHVEKMQKAGVDTIYSWGSMEAQIDKYIYQQKLDMHMAGSATLTAPKDYVDIAGYDAAQGSMHGYQAPWDLKEAKLAPAILEMAKRIKERHEQKYNEEFVYDGAFSYNLGSMALYFQAIQRAGTLDPDAVMQVIEGGTFDLFTGTYTMSGKQTYGRAVFAGTAGGMGVIEGYKARVVAESPLLTIP